MDDCDDESADVNPDASEVCDTIDNDCDGNVDDADDSLDASRSSIGQMLMVTVKVMQTLLCGLVNAKAHVDNMSDCDDTDAALNNADVDADGHHMCRC